MFTGIVEEQGKIASISKGSDQYEIKIEASKVLEDVELGASIAVNGVCLTVTSFSKSFFTVDVMPETLKATSLKGIGPGSYVNLERAMAANGRFGGHFVSGHVDGIGKIIKRQAMANAIYYEIETEERLIQYMVQKGSVAVDGTSLTIFELSDRSFTLSLIPHTLSETILGKKTVGDTVNIECDMIGKYIERFLQSKNKTKTNITTSFLEMHGFKS